MLCAFDGGMAGTSFVYISEMHIECDIAVLLMPNETNLWCLSLKILS